MKKIYLIIIFCIFFIGINKVNASNYCEYQIKLFNQKETNYLRLNVNKNMGLVTKSFYEGTKLINNDKDDIFMSTDALNSWNLSLLSTEAMYSKMVVNGGLVCPNLKWTLTDQIYFYPEEKNVEGATVVSGKPFFDKEENVEKTEKQCGLAINGSEFSLTEGLTVNFIKTNLQYKYCITDPLNVATEVCYSEPISKSSVGKKITNVPLADGHRMFLMDAPLFYDLFNKFTVNDSACPFSLYFNLTDTNNIEISDRKGGISAEADSKTFEILGGTKYAQLLGQLKKPLLKLNPVVNSYKLIIDTNKEATLNNATESNYLCDNGKNNCDDGITYYVETGIKNIALYCNELYDNYTKWKKDTRINVRMDECIAFDKFYNELVKNDILNNLGDNCGFITADLKKVITTIFDIVKIAGPVIAILLGMLDFVKVIVSGDADKEMKSASKRLMFRLIAAALLFIIPILLAWSMDLIMEGTGYDPDNPYCGVIDWSKK